MISDDDIPGFFADSKLLKSPDHLIATYHFETSLNPRLAAAALCAEQSTAQWARVGVKEDLRPLYAAKVVSLEKKAPGYAVLIAHPIANFGADIPRLLSALAGEGPFYCPGITAIRLMDIHFPDSFISQFEGPRFGTQGLRDMLQIFDRPFFMGVVKPNIGLPPADFAELAFQGWMGGLDIAKDDEMLGDSPWSRLAERGKITGKARLKAEKETGVPKMYMANVTGEENYRVEGANAFLINTFFSGYPALRSLRKQTDLPIMGHFSGMALFDRIKGFGIEGSVLVKLERLAGCDMIGLPGFGERMHTNDETVKKNIVACLEPMGKLKKSLPIPGGSDSAETLANVCRKVGHVDFGFIAGRGVFGHPDGPRAGAESIVKAWGKL